MKTVLDILYRASQRYPLKEAVVGGGERIIYWSLLRRVRRLAWVLSHDMGVKPRDRVLLQLKNSPQFIVSYFGILHAGAIPVPLGIALSKHEISYIMRDCEPVLAITSEEFAGTMEAARADSRVAMTGIATVDGVEGERSIRKFLPKAKLHGRSADIDEGETAVIIYTSGTTGYPKGVMLSHRNLISNVEAADERINFRFTDKVLAVLPFYHSFAFTVCVLMPLYVGAKVFILPSVNPLTRFVRWVFNNRITIFPGVPKMFFLMARLKIPLWVKYVNPLRLCISGAAPLDEETLKEFKNVVGTPLLEGYGLTEASPVVSVNPVTGTKKIKSVGPPLKGIEAKILDAEEREVPTGEVGELVIKGPNVMKGYYRREADTNAVLKNGWLFTGDLAKLDEEGYIFIVDRKKDLIIVNGLNVYPREVEIVLEGHPKVKEVAVVKGGTGVLTEYPVAVLSLKDGESARTEEFARYCEQRLAAYKVPRKYIIEKDLPKTVTGKILKREIKV